MKIYHVSPAYVVLLLLCCTLSCFKNTDGKSSRPTAQNLSGILTSIRQDPQINEALGTFDQVRFSLELDNIAKRIGDISQVETADSVVTALNAMIYDSLRIQFIDDRSTMAPAFPDHVLRNRTGSCLGISFLYMLLCDRIHVKAAGVVVPGHFFVRIIHNDSCRNIETMKSGKSLPDTWYREKFINPAGSNADLHSLSIEEVAGVVRFTTGNIFLQQKKYRKALDQYELAVAAIPRVAELWGNMAVAQDGLGNTGEALKYLEHVKTIAPSLKNLDRNIGALLLKKGQYDKAIEYYSQVRQLTPKDPEVLYGIGFAYYSAGKRAQARKALEELVQTCGNYRDAGKLLEKVSVP